MIKKIWMTFFALTFLLTTACEAGDEEAADDFPEGEVELLVPFEPGGGTDAVARALADETEEHLGESIGVVNTTGGGGAVGFTEGATAEPDGHTVTLVTVELVTLPHMDLADVSHEDYKGVGQMNFDPPAVTVPADAPYDTLEEFIEHAEENPGEIQMGNSGTGSIWHIAASVMEQETGVEFEHVPFDGAAPAVTELLGGHIDAVPVSPAEVLPQVEGEELKTLAVMDEERADIFPDVPTFDEEGFSGEEVGPWRGLVVPEDTPDEVAEVLEEAFAAGAEEPEFQEFMEDNGLGIEVTDGESFEQMMEESYEFYGEVMSDLDLDD